MIRQVLFALASGVAISGCADLIVTAVDDAPFTGGQQMMKATVKNDGWRGAEGSTTKLEVRTPGTDFTQRAATPTPAISSGQQVELSMWPFFLPAHVQPGQCMDVRVCADANGQVFEGWFFEGNNCRTRQFCRNP
ncbi:MAG: CARDB domain-containing protein [Burkholderiales bacterium]